MSIISHVLKDERDRLRRAIKLYRSKMKDLPKGSIRIMVRNKRKYAYLAWRDGEDVKTKYIAPVPSEKYDMVYIQVKKRKQYVKRILRMKRDLREIKKALKNG